LLAARSEPQLAPASLCEIAATARYRRLENQFYRVEVHTGGATPTFKWSRENGSVAYAVTSVSVDTTLQRTTVRLAARGRDANLDLAVNDRVELIDDEAELVGRAGQMFEYLNDGNDELELVLAGIPAGALGQDPARHPILRRWDHRPATAGDNVLPIVTGEWIELEDGVQVRFAGSEFRPGDHWNFAARTTTADVEWPRSEDGDPLDRPPAGIADAYCRLAIVEVAGDGGITVVSDCRRLFPPLTEIDQLSYVSGDGQDAAPNAMLPQPLALRVARGGAPVVGRGIRFEIESGGGSLGAGAVTLDTVTDAEGQATCDWQLGAGATAPARFQRVRAALLDRDGRPLPGQFLVFCATASLALRYVAGDGQSAAPGTALPSPLELRVVNGSDGIPGVSLRAAIELGGGAVVGPATLTTDAQGNASFAWRLGAAGRQRMRVEMLDGSGQVVQRRSFEASTGGGTATATRGCDITIGRGGDFERLSDEVLREILERGRGNACLCFLPGTHDLPELRADGGGRMRLSLHGCGHASLINVRGPLIFDAFAALELRDLVMEAEGNASLLLRKNGEVQLARVLFDRSNGDPRGAALAVISTHSVHLTGCEISARMPAMAAMFNDIEGVCRVMQNRFFGLVSFYGESDGPPDPQLVEALANRAAVRLRPSDAQLSFCDNEVSQLTIGTELARRLAESGTAPTRVFASAVIHGNTLLEANNLAVGALVAYATNAFLSRPSGDRAFYGVTLATRATTTGNLAVVLDPRAVLKFVVQDAASFSAAANQVNVQP
jgi:hypothetical protein